MKPSWQPSATTHMTWIDCTCLHTMKRTISTFFLPSPSYPSGQAYEISLKLLLLQQQRGLDPITVTCVWPNSSSVRHAYSQRRIRNKDKKKSELVKGIGLQTRQKDGKNCVVKNRSDQNMKLDRVKDRDWDIRKTVMRTQWGHKRQSEKASHAERKRSLCHSQLRNDEQQHCRSCQNKELPLWLYPEHHINAKQHRSKQIHWSTILIRDGPRNPLPNGRI